MDSIKLRLVEIVDINDDFLLPWLDLYESAFPPNERGLISEQLGLLKAKKIGNVTNESIVAAIDETKSLKGIIQYEVVPGLSAALLWYFALTPECRGKGFGTQMYKELINKLAAEQIRILIFEVERPDRATSNEARQMAERRIEFYRRLGAKVLLSVHYLQYVGPHQPPTPMHLMVHPLHPLDAEAAFALIKQIFHDAIEQVGLLGFG